MNAGQARIGQRVRTLVNFAAYPEVKVGTEATVVEVETQNEGAQDDALLIQPIEGDWWDEVTGKALCMPCLASDVELI
jgi:hypothetical protein